MPRTSDIVMGGRFMGLFIGDTGCGKTIAAASFPGPIKFYDFDGRMAPVRFFYPNRTDIEYITVGAVKESRNPNVIGYTEFCQEFENLQDNCPWETIVVDSITTLTATVVAFQLGFKNPGKGKKLSGGIQVPTWDEFNGETFSVQQILEVAKLLPCHVIFTAHPVARSESISAGTLKKSKSIACYGMKTPALVPLYFDEIYSFGVEQAESPNDPPKRIVITQPTGVDTARSALPLPPRFDISGKPLFRTLQGYLEAHQLKLQEKKVA